MTCIWLDATVVPAHSERDSLRRISRGSGIIRCWRPAITPAGSRWRGCCAAAQPAAIQPRTTSRWADTAIAALPPVFRRRLMIITDGAGASHALIAHLDKLAARRGYQLACSAGWALTGREKAALRLVPEQAWQAAIDIRGEVRERRADDACGNNQCAHRPCRLRGARSTSGHASRVASPLLPFPWPTQPEEAPDLAHHQEWTIGIATP